MSKSRRKFPDILSGFQVLNVTEVTKQMKNEIFKCLPNLSTPLNTSSFYFFCIFFQIEPNPIFYSLTQSDIRRDRNAHFTCAICKGLVTVRTIAHTEQLCSGIQYKKTESKVQNRLPEQSNVPGRRNKKMCLSRLKNHRYTWKIRPEGDFQKSGHFLRRICHQTWYIKRKTVIVTFRGSLLLGDLSGPTRNQHGSRTAISDNGRRVLQFSAILCD